MPGISAAKPHEGAEASSESDSTPLSKTGLTPSRLREWVAQSRRSQGLSETIADPATYARIAALLISSSDGETAEVEVDP